MKNVLDKIEMIFKKKKEVRQPWYDFYGKQTPHLDYPDYSMYELIHQTALKYPNYIAIEYYKNKATYKEFMRLIDKYAKSLKALGVQTGDVITICMPNTPSSIYMFYAINKIGAIANMVHPMSSEKEIELYLNMTKSKYILIIDAVYKKIDNIVKNTNVEKIIISFPNDDMKVVMSSLYWFMKGRKNKVKTNDNTITLKQFLDLGINYKEETYVERKGNDVAVILYSGGTTGEPKGIMLSNLNFNAVAYQAEFMCDPASAGDSILSIMPIFHAFGLGVCVHTILYIGMKCILIPSFSPKKFGSMIKYYRPNFLVGVPTLFEALLKTKRMGKKDLSSLTCIISGGDSLSPSLKKKVDEYLNEHGCKTKVREGYGLTESTGPSCLCPSLFYKEGTIGIPFPDTIYKIIRVGTHDEADILEDGEICISGPTIMLGYLNDEKETMNAIRMHEDGKYYLHTGDIGCMDKDGFIFFKYRLKRMIVSSGYNIYPSYIENVIDAHPAVLTSTVIGIDHPYKVQVAKAYIVLKEGYKPTHEIKKSIKEHCIKNLAKYSIPYEFEYRDNLPRTKVGKVDYKNLLEEEKNKNRR